MTTFRIREYTRPDGEKSYRVQQWRWLPIPFWSSTFFYPSGGADYGCHAATLEEAEQLLQRFIAATQEKINRRPWNHVRVTIKQVST